ncbi:MAG: aminotransferase class I/II-fold pyridoxal phosphate-dependent enzyme [Candidatus Latescibacteria bacterium]|nr:aminotransferase class I/II-fold pyridoxal phosphate-dependent enzyme [Candidatus Latescibacterota bacterium]NIM66535.1 aminotransferase class I/II-fold pyridoxal phosphate-dependent enzyme [Candidatus Latescibacterota bacterium]NIO03016.1 aminotransferase class I/II-fold pyridoxal phosphate-dependent enzyme [Candidatus Latescibacterota bacterium]NIO30152.1 aminotransferase class I/II-fold pyridoxal phosphate-dependent enzyme [Candidatus Latescibacterota bacterium]NIO57769.1 aminotransferase
MKFRNKSPLDIIIDRDSSVPIYLQIVQRIRDLINSGALLPGFRLPPERRLAEALGVNRSTVFQAYRELKTDALVGAHVGRGTVVVHRASPESELGEVRKLSWGQLVREGRTRQPDPLLRDLLQLTERQDVISLAIGLPDPELLPLEAFREIQEKLFEDVGAQVMLHCPTEGHTPLRETLSEWMAMRAIHCDASEVLVLSGSQQGLDLAARLFLDPGDTVIVEEPSYFGALQVFRAAQARLIGVPTDSNGMCTDVLARILERYRPKLIYTLPTYQNPSGAVMSLERRHHLLELAYRHHIPIIEDDPYSELRYDGEPIPPLKALDDHGYVLYLSTFSKILFPGLRIGWLVAPRPVINQFVLVKQAVDLHSNTPGQWIMDRFMRDGRYEPHINSARNVYARRRDMMEEALIRHQIPDFTWRKPTGGFYFWCRLPDDVERSQLLTQAAEAGVSFLPGWPCFAFGTDESHVRLNFSYASPEQISEGVARLMAVVQRATFEPPLARRAQIGTSPIV